MIVTVHSCRGGTGKTFLSVNLSAILAESNRRVCLIEANLQAPHLWSIFHMQSKFWFNDYLDKACGIEDALTDCTARVFSKRKTEGELFVVLANPSIEAIRDMILGDRKRHLEVLERMLSLKRELDDLQFDYVFYDTGSGLQYYSIDAIITADLVLNITTPDESDSCGIRLLKRDFYDLIEKRTAIIINKVPSESFSVASWKRRFMDAESRYPSMVFALPCFRNIFENGRKFFSAVEKPNSLSKWMIQEISKYIESESYDPWRRHEITSTSDLMSLHVGWGEHNDSIEEAGL